MRGRKRNGEREVERERKEIKGQKEKGIEDKIPWACIQRPTSSD